MSINEDPVGSGKNIPFNNSFIKLVKFGLFFIFAHSLLS